MSVSDIEQFKDTEEIFEERKRLNLNRKMSLQKQTPCLTIK